MIHSYYNYTRTRLKKIMKYNGHLKKMKVSQGQPISYELFLDDTIVNMNELLGKFLRFNFKGIIHCIECGKKTNKSFNQGFCYNCFRKVPAASECIIKPELCRGHLNEGRDVQWEQQNHVQDHYVYLAVSDAIKVGVTRGTQIPTRWIDQGAAYAMPIAKTPNRYLAGKIEVSLKELYSDKTNWRKMLQNVILEDFDLNSEIVGIKKHLDTDLAQYLLADQETTSLKYPVLEFPEKVKSVGFDKLPKICGHLHGIKGQYLLLDENEVLNIRKHTGYLVELEV